MFKFAVLNSLCAYSELCPKVKRSNFAIRKLSLEILGMHPCYKPGTKTGHYEGLVDFPGTLSRDNNFKPIKNVQRMTFFSKYSQNNPQKYSLQKAKQIFSKYVEERWPI